MHCSSETGASTLENHLAFCYMSGPPCPYVHIQGVNQAQIKNTPEKNSRKFQTAELEFAAHHQLYIVCGIYRVFQFSSVVQPCTTLCDPMNCSTPGFPVHHQLLELAQTHVHQVVMPSNHLILCCPLLLLPSIFPRIRVFSNESVLHIR